MAGTLLLSSAGFGQTVRTLPPDSEIEKGQQAIYRLQFGEAERIFEGLVKDYPEDPAGYAFLAITHWNVLLRAAGNLALNDFATPTPFTKAPVRLSREQETRFTESNDRLLEVCKRRLSSDPSDVRALYFKGVAYENLAAMSLAIDHSPRKAWGYGRNAVGLHEKVLRINPEMIDAKLTVSVEQFARATLPWSIRWLIVLFYPGDKQGALAGIEEVMAKGRYRRLDAHIVMMLLEAWKGDPRKSVEILSKLRRDYPQNYLLDLNLAAIHSTALEQPREALNVYLDLRSNLGAKTPGLGVAELNYRIGATYYRLREYENALGALSTALEGPFTEEETQALAAFLVAKIHAEQGDRGAAQQYYEKGLRAAPKGRALEPEVRAARAWLGKNGSGQ